MRYTLSLFLGCAILSVVNAGCSKQQTTVPERIPGWEYPTYQYYSVLYNKTLNNTTVYTQLNLKDEYGPSIYPPAADSVLLLNGQSVSPSDFKELAGMSDVSIRFRRKGVDFNNSVSPADISDINFSATTPAEISLNTTTVFTWDGPPLEDDEEAELEFQLNNSNRASIVSLNSNTITLDERTRPSFGTGPCKMTLRRIKHLPLSQPDSTAGGELKIKLAVERNVILK